MKILIQQKLKQMTSKRHKHTYYSSHPLVFKLLLLTAQDKTASAANNVTKMILGNNKHMHCNHFTAPWTLYGTTRVNQCQKGKTRKAKQIQIYWSKRQ